MKNLKVDEKRTRSGFFVSTRLAILIAIILALTLTGVILATYFGKPSTECQGTNTQTTNPITNNPSLTTKPDEQINYRLPMNLAPFFYELTIKPFIGPAEYYPDKNFTYEGSERIHFTCKSPTNQIIFHTNGHSFSQKSLSLKSKSDLRGLTVDKNLEFDSDKDFIIMSMSGDCQQDANYTLTFNFTGIIAEDLFGFYHSSYIDKDGNQKYLASTDLEPAGARYAFPCFDEPALKAKFKLTMWRHTKYYNVSLFNTRVRNTQTVSDDDGSTWSVDEFYETVPMSTYLVAFVVSDFSFIDMNSTELNIDVQVYAKPQSIANGEADYWDYFFRIYGSLAFTLPELVSRVTNGLNSKLDLNRVKSFIERTPSLGVAQTAFNNAVETISTSVRWREKHLDLLKKWLEKRSRLEFEL